MARAGFAVSPFDGEQDADASIQDLQSQGVAQASLKEGQVRPTIEVHGGGGTAEDAGEVAVKGTEAGVVAGAATAAIATAATGGLALPVILGFAALGSGVGAAVGAIGGAAGVDETDETRVKVNHIDGSSHEVVVSAKPDTGVVDTTAYRTAGDNPN